MSTKTNSTIRCNCCGESFSAAVYTCITPSADDVQIKEKVKSGDIFVHKCPKCGKPVLYQGPCMYLDAACGLLVVLSDVSMDDSELDKSLTARRVGSVGELIEKVKIFDDGLDDVAVELCKYVTAQDMGKQLDLKYLRMDGADGEIIFAYPQDGRMQMLSTGFSVYENCSAIVRRNPEFKERSGGLSRVDSDFIASILK